MPLPAKTKMVELCQSLEIDVDFLVACLEESVVEVHESEGRLELVNGTVLRLRRLQRICLTFQVDVPVALILSKTR